MKLFAKLFGKSAREDGGNAGHRAPQHGRSEEQDAGRPLFRDEVAGPGVTRRVDGARPPSTPPVPAA
ncbi:hypothetical protein LUX12_20065 [Streptomyces somaliensis]|nr:hypothetical protein [Streptomyces somaliensis]MCP9960303.1 hypothetical protein [Streptomyces somaliensis]MCP9973071.1 hypothetical protein [Streptomyces somaliensis]